MTGSTFYTPQSIHKIATWSWMNLERSTLNNARSLTLYKTAASGKTFLVMSNRHWLRHPSLVQWLSLTYQHVPQTFLGPDRMLQFIPRSWDRWLLGAEVFQAMKWNLAIYTIVLIFLVFYLTLLSLIPSFSGLDQEWMCVREGGVENCEARTRKTAARRITVLVAVFTVIERRNDGTRRWRMLIGRGWPIPPLSNSSSHERKT